MPTPATTPCLVGCTTSTTGTGDYILTATALPAPFSHPFFVLTDGQTITGTVSDGNAYEHGIYTYHSAGGPNGSLTRTSITSSSTAPNAARTTNPINWTPGTRNFFSDVPETGFALAANNLSDLTSATSGRNNLGLGTAATLNVGTGANQIVQRDGAGKYPAGDGSALTNLTTSPFPSGTLLWFYQNVAPTGWTKVTTIDDHVMGVTSATGGVIPNGGSLGGISWDQTFGVSVDAHVLTLAETPAHSHALSQSGLPKFIISVTSGGAFLDPQTANPTGTTATKSASTDSQGGGGGHTHTLSNATTWRPPIAWGIIASKN